MKIKRSDNVRKLFVYIRLGKISAEQMNGLIDRGRKVRLGNYLEWTLDEFGYISQSKTDLTLLSRVLEVERKKAKWYRRIFPAKKIENMSVGKYLSLLNFCKFALSDIIGALEGIKFPELTDKQKAAGFGSLKFGENGMARMVGDFENIGTVEAFKLPMHFVISSIAQFAQLSICRAKEQELIMAEMNAKNTVRR